MTDIKLMKVLEEYGYDTLGLALDIINRQQAEIKRLEAENKIAKAGKASFEQCFHEASKQLKTARADAIRDFTKVLTKEAGYFGRAVAVEMIELLAKETIKGGGKNG